MSDENFEGETAEVAKGLVSTSQYKGNAVISLRNTLEDKHPFTFGVTKAKLILDNIEAIEEFVKNNAKK